MWLHYPLLRSLDSYKVHLCFIVLSVTVCTVGYICLFRGDQIFMDFVSLLSMIIYDVLYTVLCKKSFHQVHKHSRAVRDISRAVRDGSQAVHYGLRTVHESVLCIGINGYKPSFWVLCTALWASSWTIMSSFVSKFVKCYEQLREYWSAWTIMSSFVSLANLSLFTTTFL